MTPARLPRGGIARWGIVAAAMAVLAGAAQVARKERSTVTENSSPPTSRHCAGRHCLEVPAALKRTTDEFDLRHVGVREEPNVTGDKAWAEARWARLRAKIAELRADPPVAEDPSGRVLEDRLLEPKLRGVLYNETINEDLLRWEAQLDLGDRALWLWIEFSPEFGERALARLKEVAHAYRPRRPAEPWPVPGLDAFYLTEGALVLPFRSTESAAVNFSDRASKTTLKVRIDHPTQKEAPLRDRMMSAFARGAAAITDAVAPSKYRKRSVAGLAGEQLAIVDRDEGGVTFMFASPGTPGVATEPRIDIQLDGSTDRMDELERWWDAILDSVRPAKAP